jgi:hypothetical protein
VSDLNDLIASNAVRAYNEGLQRGEAFERDRIIELLQAKDCGDDFCIHDECIFAIEIIELIQEESK